MLTQLGHYNNCYIYLYNKHFAKLNKNKSLRQLVKIFHRQHELNKLTGITLNTERFHNNENNPDNARNTTGLHGNTRIDTKKKKQKKQKTADVNGKAVTYVAARSRRGTHAQ